MNVFALWVYRVYVVWGAFLMVMFGFELMWWHFIAAAGCVFYSGWRISVLRKQVARVKT